MNPAEKLDWALDFCRRAHLRLTGPREKILRFLCAHRLPVSIDAIARSDEFVGRCAETTIYRALLLFREVDVVRQINLPGKTSYFALNAPGEPCDFLVCRRCGRVQELPAPKAVLRLEQDVAAESGFTSIYHELEFFGICPACEATAPPTKLSSFTRPLTRPGGLDG